jgi:hypothetical protein
MSRSFAAGRVQRFEGLPLCQSSIYFAAYAILPKISQRLQSMLLGGNLRKPKELPTLCRASLLSLHVSRASAAAFFNYHLLLYASLSVVPQSFFEARRS